MAPASCMAPASMPPASSMATAATSGKEFSGSQDQERTCERDCNSTVHGYLHMKGGSFVRTGPQTPDGQSGDTLSFCGLVHYPTRSQIGCCDEGMARAICGSTEGVVSKRLSSRYASGPSRNSVKTKCPDWKRVNAERHKLFEGPRKPSRRKPRRRSREAPGACPCARTTASTTAEPGYGA